MTDEPTAMPLSPRSPPWRRVVDISGIVQVRLAPCRSSPLCEGRKRLEKRKALSRSRDVRTGHSGPALDEPTCAGVHFATALRPLGSLARSGPYHAKMARLMQYWAWKKCCKQIQKRRPKAPPIVLKVGLSLAYHLMRTPEANAQELSAKKPEVETTPLPLRPPFCSVKVTPA